MKKALGRGLDSFINGGVGRAESNDGAAIAIMPPAPAVIQPQQPIMPLGQAVQQVSLDQIERSRFQPRTEFAAEELHELAESIKQRGVVQPLLVRHLAGAAGRYELIAGERRWRAAREAGLQSVPVILRQATDQEVLELALIENLQREDLNPIEEARAYRQLASQFQLTQEQIAEKVGRSRAAVANAMRLLDLPEEVQSWIASDRLTVGHAKAILGLTIPDEQRLVAERVMKQGLTVRETEQLVEQLKGLAKGQPRVLGVAVKDPHVIAIEERLRQRFGTGINVRHNKGGKGRIVIEYYNNDELARVLGLLGVENL